MRKPILCLLLAGFACDRPPEAEARIIDDFAGRATPLSCEPVDLGTAAAPTELRLATDSTWTILDAPQLRILTFDEELRPLGTTTIPSTGPGAALNPTSVAALGDSAFAVAAQGGLRLVILSPEGAEIESIPLEFVPNAVAAGPGGSVWLTPLPFGPRPPTLLMRFTRDGWDTLPVPKRSYADLTVNALGNSALVETLPDGGALVVHQFLKPRAFRVGGAGVVEPLAVPTPDGTRQQIDFVPRSPITEDQLPLTLLPAIAMTVDRVRSEVLVLTRSGHELNGHPERAILRLTTGLAFIEGYTLPVRAGSMVYLPRRRAAVVADAEDRYYLCPFPGSERHDQSA